MPQDCTQDIGWYGLFKEECDVLCYIPLSYLQNSVDYLHPTSECLNFSFLYL